MFAGVKNLWFRKVTDCDSARRAKTIRGQTRWRPTITQNALVRTLNDLFDLTSNVLNTKSELIWNDHEPDYDLTRH